MTTTTSHRQMWALVDETGGILGVYDSRGIARSYRGMVGGTVRKALVSVI